MSSSGFDLGNQSRRTAEAQSDMYDALEDLGNTINRGHDLLEEVTGRHRRSEDALERLLEEVEQDYRTVSDFAERNTERQREMNETIKDLGRSSPQPYGWSTGFGQTQWFGSMQQQQRVFGQQQRMGWNSFWSNPYQQQQQGYRQQQQQSQSQNWQEEFFGDSEEDDLLDEEKSTAGGSVDIDETADEPESNEYDDADSYDSDEDLDGSVDMGDSWNPDASFDYEAEQSTETVNQSFSFSGSGFEPSGSITMEQSAGGETHYFEASF